MHDLNPGDGEWCLWDNYQQCSATCGDGTQHQTRVCGCPAPEYGGAECDGDEEQSIPCNDGMCPRMSFLQIYLLLYLRRKYCIGCL